MCSQHPSIFQIDASCKTHSYLFHHRYLFLFPRLSYTSDRVHFIYMIRLFVQKNEQKNATDIQSVINKLYTKYLLSVKLQFVNQLLLFLFQVSEIKNFKAGVYLLQKTWNLYCSLSGNGITILIFKISVKTRNCSLCDYDKWLAFQQNAPIYLPLFPWQTELFGNNFARGKLVFFHLKLCFQNLVTLTTK